MTKPQTVNNTNRWTTTTYSAETFKLSAKFKERNRFLLVIRVGQFFTMEDQHESTRCGKFGYEVISDQVFIPYIFRGNRKLCAEKIFSWHLNSQQFGLSANLFDFGYLSGHDMNHDESCLFKEINKWHNNSMYPVSFKEKDSLVYMDDIREIFKYAHDCTQKSMLGDKYKMAGGIVRIQYVYAEDEILPYVRKDGKLLIPVQFLFRSTSLPRTLSVTTLNNIDVMYLRYVLEVSKMCDLQTELHKSQVSKFNVPCVQLDEFIAFLSKENIQYIGYDDKYWIHKDSFSTKLNDNQNFFNNNNQNNNHLTEKSKVNEYDSMRIWFISFGVKIN